MLRGISDGHWIDLERAFAVGRGVRPSSTCQFQLVEDKGSRRDFLLACPIALAGCNCVFCFARPLVYSSFRCLCGVCCSLHGMLLLIGLGLILPFGLLVGFSALIVLGLLSRMRFNISGMFTFGKLALFLSRFESNFFVCATPLM